MRNVSWRGLGWPVLVLACLVLAALGARAGEFSVGRVDVKFSDEGWTEVPLPDSERTYGGDRNGALPVRSKLYVRGSTGSDVQVLVLVSATQGGLGGGHMTYSPQCEPDPQEYREGNSGFRRSFAQCLVVFPLYTSESVFKELAPEIAELRRTGALSVRNAVYSVWSRHAISTGAFVDVRVFTVAPIEPSGGAVTESLPDGVLPAHVAWGRQLKEAVKSSVYSLSGRLDVPPLHLVPPSPPASRAVALGG